MPDPEKGESFSSTPATRTGWTVEVFGWKRCVLLGHELGDLCHYTHGFIVGYCVRCETRVEIPWFRGGTMAALASHMADEAAEMTNPAPSVVEDLDQIIGLVANDIQMLQQAHQRVLDARQAIKANLTEPS
jgi:hypothetical protein